MSSIPPIEADAPNVAWAIDFQFGSTIDLAAVVTGFRKAPSYPALQTIPDNRIYLSPDADIDCVEPPTP